MTARFEEAFTSPAYSMSVESIDAGRVTVRTEFLPLLRANGLDSFESVMRFEGGKVFRNFPGRRTVRLELKARNGKVEAIFLKRYESNYLSLFGRLLRLVRWPGAGDEAQREWEMIQAVAGCGIQTAVPIALGQAGGKGHAIRSFLMTAEISKAEEGSTYASRLNPLRRRAFLLRVAELARRFHSAGFVHKDFYLGHVLVSENEGKADLFLIDLQRVTEPCCFGDRWRTKDLGGLAYSMLNAGARRTDLMACFLAYLGQAELRREDKRTIRRILPRVARLQRRRPKYDG